MNMQTTTMGMPASVTIVDANAQKQDIEAVFALFAAVDERFSTYKPTSEVSRINAGKLPLSQVSQETKYIFDLCEETKQETNGYFDIVHNGKLDPSGIVKGYAIHQATVFLRQKGYRNFFVTIAGDMEVAGVKEDGSKWKVGIENPFNRSEIVKVIEVTDNGVATSGTYVRGAHIYNPHTQKPTDDIAGITVIADNIYEADRFATAAFAMGEKGILFLEQLPGIEGYMITKEKKGISTMGFDQFVLQ